MKLQPKELNNLLKHCSQKVTLIKQRPNGSRPILRESQRFTHFNKIHKPTPVGRPINSGCSGPTERISAFVDHLIQLIAQLQASYLEIRETLFTSSRGLNCLKLPLFQWTSQAYTQTYHNERALPLYARYTKNFTKETLQCPYQVFKRKA